MNETRENGHQNGGEMKETPKLLALLKELKDGLGAVKKEVQSLCLKVKQNLYPTADGLSVLETKHLLLLNYCQTIVYYLLRKAKGHSIEGHPVVRSLVEIRLFLEKMRPIDKKLEYQIKKSIRNAREAAEHGGVEQNQLDATQKTEDLLDYRPNPDMLKPKKIEGEGDVYRPPKFIPTSIDEEKMSKQDKQDRRREDEILRQSRQNPYVRDIMNDLEGKPEEVRETFGSESREVTRYREKMEERSRREEDLFIRAPVTKKEKQREKRMKKSRNGLSDMTDGLLDEVRNLPMEDDNGHGDDMTNFNRAGRGGRRPTKRKRRN